MDQIWGNTTQYTEIVWGWQIAVYLFLAGLSAGALISAILVKWRSNLAEGYDGIMKAGALIALPAISLGLALLVVDLGKPFSFWMLMFHFNLKSVMSIGVILLSVYSGLMTIFAAVIFKKEFAENSWTAWAFRPFLFIVEWFEGLGKWFDWVMLVLAIGIAAYTGFLLSALVAKPLLNVPVLPLLFLVSGISSGVAGCIAVSILFFKRSVQESNLKYLLSLDTKLIPTELFILFVMFIGLFNMGGQYAIVGQQALTIGVWAKIFWGGIIGIGLLGPLFIVTFSLHQYEQSDHAPIPVGSLLINSALVLTGVILLRFYMLYAGQTFI